MIVPVAGARAASATATVTARVVAADPEVNTPDAVDLVLRDPASRPASAIVRTGGEVRTRGSLELNRTRSAPARIEVSASGRVVVRVEAARGPDGQRARPVGIRVRGPMGTVERDGNRATVALPETRGTATLHVGAAFVVPRGADAGAYRAEVRVAD